MAIAIASQELPATGFIRQAQLVPAIIPFSSATLWWKVKDGSFPAPVKLSELVTAWEVSAVRDWIGFCLLVPPALRSELPPANEHSNERANCAPKNCQSEVRINAYCVPKG